MKKHQLLQTSSIHETVNFVAPGYGIGLNKGLRIPTMIEQMQEAALLSTRNLGVSVFDLEPLGLGWVLLGQNIKINRCPTLAESCQIITCPTGFEKVFTFRDFHWINPENDELLATASTTWMLMDLNTRRLAMLPDWIKNIDQKTPPKNAFLRRASHKLIPPKNPEMIREFQVGYHEVDFNGHLTNPFYVRWMLEALGIDELRTRPIVELDVQFAKEARYGDILQLALTKTGPDGIYHQGLFREGELLASMQTKLGRNQ